MIRRINGKLTRTYSAWKSMRSRVKSDSKAHAYKNRGIECCKEWGDFERFYIDMGECPDEFSLERIDVNKSYLKSNCEWIPLKDQSKNKQNSVRVTYQGKTMLLKDVCEINGVVYSSAWRRLKQGCSLDQVLDRNLYEKIEWQGRMLTYSEAAAIAGIKRKTLQNRIKIQGWSTGKAMTTPLLRRKSSATPSIF